MLAENEESWREALTVAGGSHFLMLLLMTMICMEEQTVKMKMSKMVGGIENH